MSIKHIAWAFEQSLRCSEKMVLVALSDSCNADGVAFPSQAFLAKKCGLSRQRVNVLLGNLEADGLINIRPRERATGASKSYLYELNVPDDIDESLNERRPVFGCVYVISDGSRIKIGVSRNHEKRIKGIETGAGLPITICKIFPMEMAKARRVEQRAHAVLDDCRTLGEWFNTSVDNAIGAVEDSIKKEEGPVSSEDNPCQKMRHPLSKDETRPVSYGDTFNRSTEPLPEPLVEPIDRPPACETRKTDISLAFENYNLTADTFDLPRAIRLTEDRRKKLRQRLKEHGLEGWNKALENIEQSRFLQGDNERGWRISFDFMLQPTSLNKLIEGGYSDATGPPNEARAAFRNLRDGP